MMSMNDAVGAIENAVSCAAIPFGLAAPLPRVARMIFARRGRGSVGLGRAAGPC
jgi:hypothetical protein